MRSHLKFNPNNFELPKKLPSVWTPAPNPARPYPPSSHVPVLDSHKHNNHPLFSVNTPQTKCPSLFYLLTSCQDWLWQSKILYWIWHTTRKFTNHTYFVSESLKSHQLLQVMAQITIAVHFFLSLPTWQAFGRGDSISDLFFGKSLQFFNQFIHHMLIWRYQIWMHLLHFSAESLSTEKI